MGTVECLCNCGSLPGKCPPMHALPYIRCSQTNTCCPPTYRVPGKPKAAFGCIPLETVLQRVCIVRVPHLPVGKPAKSRRGASVSKGGRSTDNGGPGFVLNDLVELPPDDLIPVVKEELVDVVREQKGMTPLAAWELLCKICFMDEDAEHKRS